MNDQNQTFRVEVIEPSKTDNIKIHSSEDMEATYQKMFKEKVEPKLNNSYKSIEQLKKEAEERVKELNLSHWVFQCATANDEYQKEYSENSYYYDGKEGYRIVASCGDNGTDVGARVEIEKAGSSRMSGILVYHDERDIGETELHCFKDGPWVDIIIEEGKKAASARKEKQEKELKERLEVERQKFLPL